MAYYPGNFLQRDETIDPFSIPLDPSDYNNFDFNPTDKNNTYTD